MSAETIAAEVAKQIEGMRLSADATVWSHYVNKNGVAVKRRIDIGPEQVDGAALTPKSGQVAA